MTEEQIEGFNREISNPAASLKDYGPLILLRVIAKLLLIIATELTKSKPDRNI